MENKLNVFGEPTKPEEKEGRIKGKNKALQITEVFKAFQMALKTFGVAYGINKIIPQAPTIEETRYITSLIRRYGLEQTKEIIICGVLDYNYICNLNQKIPSKAIYITPKIAQIYKMADEIADIIANKELFKELLYWKIRGDKTTERV